MLDWLFNPAFWYNQAAVIIRAPWLIIPLLFAAGLVGWKIQSLFHDREMKRLNAENYALKIRLSSVHKKHSALTKHIADVKPELALLNANIDHLMAAPMVPARLEAVAATTTVVIGKVEVVRQANNALAAILSGATRLKPPAKMQRPTKASG